MGANEGKTLVGKFVADQRYGPSKVTAVEATGHRLEYFISPWNRKVVVAKIGNATPLRLYEQTRVYVQLDGVWNMGRIIIAHQRNDGGYDYDVGFPNKKVLRLQEELLFCRCWLPHDDPTVALSLGGMETQYWHEHRQKFNRTLLEQRSACRGMSTFLSSRVEFVPHQLDVVRRVLEDPLQRYLLADEVGMGKTIEAGFIVRQFLLSEIPGNVCVVAPNPLVQQWRQELEQKFSIDEFPDRVQVLSIEEAQFISDRNFALLVIDEAHHLVITETPRYIERLANASPRLLLLSATPALGNSDVLFRLLKLIDPDRYKHLSESEFASKVEKREEFGLFLRGLRNDANPVVLKQRLKRLPELFSEDQEAMAIGAAISQALVDNDQNQLSRNIGALRNHVADAHRIHQRLIRTRRRDAAEWVFRPRGKPVEVDSDPDTSHIYFEWINDSRIEAIFDTFEQWRTEMAFRHQSHSSIRQTIVQWHIKFFEALGCGTDCFFRALSSAPSEIVDDEFRVTFNSLYEQKNDEPRREALIAMSIQRHLRNLQNLHPGKLPRVVVFGSDLEDLKLCANSLEKLIGPGTVLRGYECESDESIASEFESDTKVQALFCTRAEEEGINIHFADALVHLDLPFSPSRIEQRIGRLDRFGRKFDRLEQRIIFPSVREEISLWEAWFDLLANAFCVFNEPIADVQFSLETISVNLANVLFENGASGMREKIGEIRKQLIEEREKLDNQFALDQVLQEEGTGTSFFQNLDDLEANENEIGDAISGWMVQALQFICKGDHRRIFRFQWDQDHTLLPVWPWAKLFQSGLNYPVTYSRNYALRNLGDVAPKLLRIGSPLIRIAEREFKWDDRGTAFATWRKILPEGESEFIAFKLCYVVEARLPDGLNDDEKNSLRARLDGYLPPWTDVLFVDVDLNPIESGDRLSQLSVPYKSLGSQGQDFNLGSRRKALNALIDPMMFERLCVSIRTSSETWLRNQPRFQQKINEATNHGIRDIDRRIRRLDQRRKLLDDTDRTMESELDREIDLNKILHDSLNNPSVKLDAIGMIVLSSQSPQDYIGDEA